MSSEHLESLHSNDAHKQILSFFSREDWLIQYARVIGYDQMHVWTKIVSESNQGRSSLTCIKFIRHALVVFAVLHFLFLLLLLELLLLPLRELPLEA